MGSRGYVYYPSVLQDVFADDSTASYSVTIPTCVAAGEYLLRIEQLAIHNPGSPPQVSIDAHIVAALTYLPSSTSLAPSSRLLAVAQRLSRPLPRFPDTLRQPTLATLSISTVASQTTPSLDPRLQPARQETAIMEQDLLLLHNFNISDTHLLNSRCRHPVPPFSCLMILVCINMAFVLGDFNIFGAT